jgi:Flp pilus assembly protein TadD
MLFRTVLLSLGAAILAWPSPGHADEALQVQKLLQAQDWPAAQQRAEAALKLQPQNASLRFLRGVALLEQRQDEAAQRVFMGLAEDFPELPEPHNNLALLHARAGRWEAARLALETALRNDPQHLTARRNLGDVHLQLAVQAWQAAATAQPGDSGLARRLRLAPSLLAPGTDAAR